jgi:hypothetical protein
MHSLPQPVAPTPRDRDYPVRSSAVNIFVALIRRHFDAVRLPASGLRPSTQKKRFPIQQRVDLMHVHLVAKIEVRYTGSHRRLRVWCRNQVIILIRRVYIKPTAKYCSALFALSKAVGMKDANVSAVYKVNNQRDDKVRVARHSPYRRI